MEPHDDERPPRELSGVWYADSFDVAHTALQFHLDCGGERGEELVKAYLRIIASPVGARDLFRLLGVALLRYADTFGPIGEGMNLRRDGGAP